MTSLKTNQTILFTGDSITDCGRRDVNHRPIGCGYVSYVRDMLVINEPEKNINVINTGIGGNTVDDLRSRWIDDVIAHNPDFLSIKIGINDCNQFLCHPAEKKLQSPENFAEIYDLILNITKEMLPETKLLLISPFYGSLDYKNEVVDSYRSKVHNLVPEYIKIVEEMSKKHKTTYLNLHEVFHKIFKQQRPHTFFPNEPVHPNQTGHMLIAREVYNKL